MNWQGGAVLGLIVLSIIASGLIKSHPRDLIFAIGALTTPLLGIVPSSQICQALANRTMFTVLALWLLISAWRERRFFPSPKTFREKFPLPLLLEIFGAYLFYFALMNSGLDLIAVPILQNLSQWSVIALLFLAAQAFSFLMPRPVAFAILFSAASPLFQKSLLLTAAIALSLLLNFFFLQRPFKLLNRELNL